MATQKWWWLTVASLVVLLSTVVGSTVQCATGYLVIAANETKQLPAAIDNKPGPPIVSCRNCSYMVISANTQTQIIFHCFNAIKWMFFPSFPEVPEYLTDYYYSWEDQPSKGESASIRKKISPNMTFKDALDEHQKIFPPSNASTVTAFHCFHGEFRATFVQRNFEANILAHIRPMHIQSTDSKMKCFIKVVKARKGWPFRISTIEYGSVGGHLCPKTRCEQNEDGMSAMCCCHGSGCNNAPLMDAVTWAASAHRRVTPTPAIVTTPQKITAASTTNPTTTLPESTTASEPSTTTDKTTIPATTTTTAASTTSPTTTVRETTVPTTTTTTAAPTTTVPQMTKPNTLIFEEDTIETTSSTTSAITTTSSLTTAGENTVIFWAALITISVLLLLALVALLVVICIMLRRRQKVMTKNKSDDPPVIIVGRRRPLRLRNKAALDDENSVTTTDDTPTTDDAPKSKAYIS